MEKKLHLFCLQLQLNRQNTCLGAEGMTLRFRTLAAPLQDPASVPRVHIAISPLPGIQNPFLAPMGTRHAHGTWTCMHIQ